MIEHWCGGTRHSSSRLMEASQPGQTLRRGRRPYRCRRVSRIHIGNHLHRPGEMIRWDRYRCPVEGAEGALKVVRRPAEQNDVLGSKLRACQPE